MANVSQLVRRPLSAFRFRWSPLLAAANASKAANARSSILQMSVSTSSHCDAVDKGLFHGSLSLATQPNTGFSVFSSRSFLKIRGRRSYSTDSGNNEDKQAPEASSSSTVVVEKDVNLAIMSIGINRPEKRNCVNDVSVALSIDGFMALMKIIFFVRQQLNYYVRPLKTSITTRK